jgi:hypothetical protein
MPIESSSVENSWESRAADIARRDAGANQLLLRPERLAQDDPSAIAA